MGKSLKDYKVTDLGQRKFLVDKTAEIEARAPEWLPLRDRLLALGGEFVLFPKEDEMGDFPYLLREGRLWKRYHPRVRRMQSNRCHQNCLTVWGGNPDGYDMVTGFALSDDGLWREHSWLVKKNTEQLVETTVLRVAYFGYVLSPERITHWCQVILGDAFLSCVVRDI